MSKEQRHQHRSDLDEQGITIRVADAMSPSTTVSGTKDGGILFRVVSDAFKSTSGDITLDFEGITALSYSAGCSFWVILMEVLGNESTGRILIRNVNQRVFDGLTHGFEQAKARTG